MNIRKQKHSLSVILIIFMLFLGTCYEDIHAGFSFTYRLNTQTDSTLRSSQNTSLSNQAYLEESPGKPIGSVIRQAARRNSSKTGRDTYLSLFTAGILWQFYPITFILLSHSYGSEVHSNTVIIDYIHHKDGKKAIA